MNDDIERELYYADYNDAEEQLEKAIIAEKDKRIKELEAQVESFNNFWSGILGSCDEYCTDFKHSKDCLERTKHYVEENQRLRETLLEVLDFIGGPCDCQAECEHCQLAQKIRQALNEEGKP